MNRPSNSGMPSSRNRRTTDGLPTYNKCDKFSHRGPNIIRISVLTCNISPREFSVPASTIHMFALPSNTKCIKTTLKSVTMFPESFLNMDVGLQCISTGVGKLGSSFFIPGRLGSNLLFNLQRYKMSRKNIYVPVHV